MSSMLTLAGNAAPTGFYDFPIGQSLRFEDGDSAYLSRTPASAGNRKTWTFSCWVKRGNLGSAQIILAGGSSDTDRTIIRFGSSDNIEIDDYTGSYNFRYITNAVFRDVSAFYHITVVADISNATTTERVRLYVNGERITSFSTESTPLTSINTRINNNVPQQIGKHASGSNQYYDGYMAEVNFIDGQALDPTSFGETKSGIWTPRDTAGLTFGTNGFRLQFGDTTEANGFNAVTYTGNGSSQSISGVGFSSSPDFVWIKERSSTSGHILVNSVRGANKLLSSNTADSEQTDANKVASLDSDGFSLGSSGAVNQSSQTYVAWCWDAGSGSSGSNTDGSITSTVKANQTYGFSTLFWTGTASAGTVGHGLSSAPEMIIAKNGSAGDQNWQVFHTAVGSTFSGQLQSTTAFLDRTYWNDTDPTSSVFSISGQDAVNENGNTIIAYAFHSVAGYSKFGSYTGTGAAGNSITLGFKPAFLLIKETGNANSWELFDNTRNTSSPFDKRLFPNDSAAEATTTSLSYSDTGFETLNGNTGINRSGGSYIFMAFADTRNAAFWKDTSGEGNDWQPNNLVFSDVVPDSATNNFAVLNNLETNDSGATYTEGNLVFQTKSAGSNVGVASFSIPKSSKWYWEVNVLSTSGTVGDNARIGLQVGNNITPSLDVRYKSNGDKSVNNASSAYGASYAAGDIIGVAVDADSNTVEFYKNGSSQGSISYTMDADSDYFPVLPEASGTINIKFAINFGQDSTFAGNESAGGNADANGLGDFFGTVPDDALALCTANLPTGAIDTLADETPEDYFNTVLYSGNQTDSHGITGVGFQPSLTWIKERSSTSSHLLVDAVRGSTKGLASNASTAEENLTAGEFVSFDSDGFTVDDNNRTNQSSQTYVGWNWKANGAGVSNTDGSITSTVSASETSQGNKWFSVVKWTGNATAGATVGHGLTSQPRLIITKNMDVATNWSVLAQDANNGSGHLGYIRLDLTAAWASTSILWNNTEPTSSVFTLGSYGYVNGSGQDIIGYCFANADGLCRVGSYVGNGNTGDGTFVYTGHKPSFLLIKRTDAVDNWPIEDNERNPSNLNRNYLLADTSGAEGTVDLRDFLSNGFKVRGSAQNASGGNYIYLSIASQPFKYANAR